MENTFSPAGLVHVLGLARRQPKIEEHIGTLAEAAVQRDDCVSPEQYRQLALLTVNRCVAVLKERQPADQGQAEMRFVAAIERLVGDDPQAIFEAHQAWVNDPQFELGQSWAATVAEATAASLAPVGGVEEAYVETVFIDDV